MPTRMIRESMLDSHRYASLGDPAKLLFIHLLLLADDFGCIDVGPTFLRRRAFYNSPTNEHIAKLISELADADMIRCYEADGAQLAFVPRFRQRLQRNSLKHIAPPESLLRGDSHAIEMFNKIKEVTKNPTVGQPLSTVGQRREVEVKRSEVVPPPARKKPAPDSALQAVCRTTWNAYSDAYEFRHGAPPIRDAKASSAIKRFCQSVPASEAPEIARFFLQNNSSFYVQKMHPPTILAQDAAKLRTEWVTGAQITQTQAMQTDKTASRKSVFTQLIKEIDDGSN